MDLGLKDKKAIVTGGTGGIGLAIVKALADEGVHVVTCSRRAAACKELETGMQGRKVSAIPCDVGDREAYSGFLQQAYDTLGGVDIFIPNVSGMGFSGEEGWQTAFEVDVMATVRGCEALRPALAEGGWGAVVIIASISATECAGSAGAYGSMKAALISYAAQLSKDVSREGVQVNTVSPGPIHVDDGFWGGVRTSDPAQYDMVASMHGAGRLGTPEEVARAAVFLASPAASWVTGTNLKVDGGFTSGIQF